MASHMFSTKIVKAFVPLEKGMVEGRKIFNARRLNTEKRIVRCKRAKIFHVLLFLILLLISGWVNNIEAEITTYGRISL